MLICKAALLLALVEAVEAVLSIADEHGCEFDVRTFSPVFLAEKARGATRKAAALEEARARPGSLWPWSLPPAWRPINELLGLKETETWSGHHKGCLRWLATLSHWPQGRLARHKEGIDPRCLLCQEEVGTVFHRQHRCPAWEPWRRDRLPPDLKRAAVVVDRMGEPCNELFSLGLFVDPAPLLQRPPWQPSWRRMHNNWAGADFLVVPDGALVFTDGSCIFGDFPTMRCAGWAAIVMSPEGAIIAQAWGALPPALMPWQAVRVGEDYAAVVALTEIIGNFHLLIDCKGTVEAVQNLGRAKGPTSVNAHLWARVGDAADGAQVKHIPAHKSEAAVTRGELTAPELFGNRLADIRAKEGAALQAPQEDDVVLLEGCLARARDAARFAAEIEVFISDGWWEAEYTGRDGDHYLAAARRYQVEHSVPREQLRPAWRWVESKRSWAMRVLKWLPSQRAETHQKPCRRFSTH